MRGVIAGAVVTVITTAHRVCAPPARAQQPPPRIVSPEIGADRRVTFRLLAPNVREIVLTGAFLQGGRNLEKNDAGVWSVTVGPVEPEIYHYNLSEISPLLFQ
jgi:1,4-alpha-glucan branching enzyme